MKLTLGSRRHHYVARVSVFLITAALIAGLVGCVAPAEDNPAVSSAEGDEVTSPGEGTSAQYDGGTVSMNFPDPNFLAVIGVALNDTTVTTNPLPSDVQHHTFFG